MDLGQRRGGGRRRGFVRYGELIPITNTCEPCAAEAVSKGGPPYMIIGFGSGYYLCRSPDSLFCHHLDKHTVLLVVLSHKMPRGIVVNLFTFI